MLVHPLPHRLGPVDRSANGGDVASFVASDNVAGGKQAADALAKGEPVEAEVPVEVVTVTKDNVANFK